MSSAVEAAKSFKSGTVCTYNLDSTWQGKALFLAWSVDITVKMRHYRQKNVRVELFSGGH